MLGMKFFSDTPKDLANSIIEKAANENLGLEILMVTYNEKKLCPIETILEKIENTRFDQAADWMLHTDNHNTFGANIKKPEVWDSFSTEMKNANRMGIKKAVMHYNDKMTVAEAEDDKKILEDLLRINELGSKYGVNIHLENTIFHHEQKDFEKANLAFYEKMFDIVMDEDLTNIGFCYDIGHGKVFSDNKVVEWMAFMDKLQQNKVPLHMHLHNNHGVDDDHMPFHIADREGLNDGDAYTSGKHYLTVLNELLERYNSMHLVEIQSKYAIQEMDWLAAQLPKYAGK